MTKSRASDVQIGGHAAIGARASQQDVFAMSTARLETGRSARLFVVADGMGGHSGGEVASNVAVERFLGIAEAGHWASYAETLRQALLAANRAIADRVDREPHLGGMGCTLLAGIVEGRTLWYISVGDSILLRVTGAAIERLNADHSMAPLLDSVAARTSDFDVSEQDLQRHMLRSAVTGRPIPLIDENTVVLQAGDRLIAASDGLLTLDPPEIAAIVAGLGKEPPAPVAQALVAHTLARAMPDQDNITVVVTQMTDNATRGRDVYRWGFGLVLLIAGAVAIFYAFDAFRAERVRAGPSAPAPHATPRSEPAVTTRRAGFPQAPVVVTTPVVATKPAHIQVNTAIDPRKSLAGGSVAHPSVGADAVVPVRSVTSPSNAIAPTASGSAALPPHAPPTSIPTPTAVPQSTPAVPSPKSAGTGKASTGEKPPSEKPQNHLGS